MEVKVANLRDLTPPAEPGIVVTNPPYGERIAPADLFGLYKMMGDVFKSRFQGYDAFVFTGNLEAAKNIGLRTSRRIQLYNGNIECRLLKYELYRGSRKGEKEAE